LATSFIRGASAQRKRTAPSHGSRREAKTAGSDLTNQKEGKRMMAAYFSGTYIEDRDAPIPGVPCLTGLFVTANSPK
jgi:hypothetical protein